MGEMRLGVLHKLRALSWKEVSVELYTTPDHGASWQLLTTVNDRPVFNDRDFLSLDAGGRLRLTHSTRVPTVLGGDCVGPDAVPCNFPISYLESDDLGESFSPPRLVNRPETRPAGTVGGFSLGPVETSDGRLVIVVSVVPEATSADEDHSAYVYVSTDGGASFADPYRMIPADAQPLPGEEGESSPLASLSRPAVVGEDVSLAWVGARAGGSALYVRTLRGKDGTLDDAVVVAEGGDGAMTLPVLTADRRGGLHLFWLAEAEGGWVPMYARSTDGGRGFGPAIEVSDVRFPNDRWPGDFNAATTNQHDLFFAWTAAGGPDDGVYLSVARGLID
jgi:hypothetical protein